jgi:hypothetical protein
MPKPHNFYPFDRGSLSLNTTEYLADQVASGAATVTGNVGFYAQVGVGNISTSGYLLYVVGCSLWTNDPAGQVTLKVVQNVNNSGVVVPFQTLNPLVAALDGSFGYTANGLNVGGTAVWRLGGGQAPDFWPYDSPLAILPMGWSLYTMPDNTATTVSCAYRWIAVHQ